MNAFLHWPTIRRIALIVGSLGLACYLFWLQRYTFTDADITWMFGSQIFRTTINAKEGQKLCFGSSIDGSRSENFVWPIRTGQSRMTLAVSFEHKFLSVGIRLQPPGSSNGAEPQRFQFGEIKSNMMEFMLVNDPDGSVWFAEWDEEKDGKKNHVRFGYWLE